MTMPALSGLPSDSYQWIDAAVRKSRNQRSAAHAMRARRMICAVNRAARDTTAQPWPCCGARLASKPATMIAFDQGTKHAARVRVNFDFDLVNGSCG
jgi:hypothetical protein